LSTKTLVEPLGHVVLDEFFDQPPQMALAEDDELIQALVLYRPHKPLGVRIPDSIVCIVTQLRAQTFRTNVYARAACLISLRVWLVT
jgi:hypothetical protein